MLSAWTSEALLERQALHECQALKEQMIFLPSFIDPLYDPDFSFSASSEGSLII